MPGLYTILVKQFGKLHWCSYSSAVILFNVTVLAEALFLMLADKNQCIGWCKISCKHNNLLYSI